MGRSKTREDVELRPGRVSIELFNDELTGYSADGIKLCFENALKARGYKWRLWVTEMHYTRNAEEEQAKKLHKKAASTGII